MTKLLHASSTGTLPGEVEHGPQQLGEPFLFVAFHADDPAAPVSRHALGGVDEVLLRRGTIRGALRVREGSKRQLVLTFPDRCMSAMHARLRRRGSDFWIEDADSKNGTVLDGKRVATSCLATESVVEVGQTFLLFKSGLSVPGDGEKDRTVGGGSSPSRLSTLSPHLERSFHLLGEVADSTIPVLLRGETGTGKEVVADALHRLSKRTGAFIPVNCGAIPSTLVESELFGFRKGSFSGAVEDRVGLARAADSGTLFLDEVGDLPLPAQTAFLRLLQERKVVPVGGVSPIGVDFRLVSATHQNLEDLLARRLLREDVLARLSGFCVRMPALRERREDLGLLVAQLLAEHANENAITFSVAAVRTLFTHAWPQNIRELRRRLALALVLAKDGHVEREHLFGVHGDPISHSELAVQPQTGAPTTPPEPENLEPADLLRRDQLVALLKEHRGNVTAVAQAMGKARKQVQRWMRRYGISRTAVPSGG
jgi:DNA-binding NtrC family response regulator